MRKVVFQQAKASADTVCGGFPLFPLDFFFSIRYYIV